MILFVLLNQTKFFSYLINLLRILRKELITNIKILLKLLKQSKNAYINYNSNNSQYFFAEELRFINKKIFTHIETKKLTEDTELKNALSELKEHLVQWMLLWDKKNMTKDFNLNDEFRFKGYKTYPKKLDSMLSHHLKKLVNEN